MRLGAIYTFMKKYHTYLMRHRQDYLYTKKILGPETCFHLHIAIHVTHLSIVKNSKKFALENIVSDGTENQSLY